MPINDERYIIKDVNSGEVHIWSVPTIIRNINRDRSDGWIPYNKKDWKEGLKYCTEFKLIRKVRIR